MRKRYLLSDEDFDTLTTALDRDPRFGVKGGSSHSEYDNPEMRRLALDLHAHFNYQVRVWIERMKTQ